MRATRLWGALLAAAALAAPAAAQEQPEKALENKVTFSFRDTELHLVIDALQAATGANIALDPRVDRWRASVTAQVTDEPGSAIVEAIEEQLSLEHTTWCDVLYLHPAGQAPGAEPKVPGGAPAALLGKQVSVAYERTPLSEVVANLKARAQGLDFVLPARVRIHVRKTMGVTLRLNRVPLASVIALVARDQGLSWAWENGRIAFSVDTEQRDVTADTIDYDVAGGDTLSGATPTVDVEAEVRRLANPSTRDTAARMLMRAGKGALPKVARVLATADPATASAALRVLEASGDPSEYAAVLKLFADTERSLDLRKQAGLTLAAMKAPEAVPSLVEFLDDVWFGISETARRALVATGEPTVTPLEERWVRELAKPEPKDGILYRGLLIFGEIGGQQAQNRLIRALATTRGSRAVAIRHHAAMGLGFTGDPKAILPLVRALEREKDFLVAKYIARSLTWITGEELPPSGDRWRAWWSQEGQEKYALQDTADDLLKDLGGMVELPLDENGFPILESDDQRAQRLIAQLRSPERDAQKAAAKSLEAMGKSALPALRKVEDDRQIGSMVRWLIARIEAR